MSRIYTYAVDPASDTAAANVLRFVEPGQTVLEIGAGPGSITRPLVELNHARMTAIELDPESVATLETFCDRVIQADLNDTAWPQTLNGDRFDTVVIADVLEHLRDPWTVLSQAAGLLRTGGSVVVSLPHAAHAAVLASLIGGDLSYRDWGLLDRTHIRFFAIKNVQALFDHAGLAITDIAYVVREPEQTELADAWRALPERTRTILQENAFSNVYQVVIKARRDAAPGLRLLEHLPPNTRQAKLIAFYLPQFHPIPENDAWWGKGFTEWTNVTKAQPLFDGHYQPHLPGELGFYDLRLRQVQQEQIALAKRFGVDAFCFHYYWFGGRRLLERPLLDFLADPAAEIEFCLNWGNENWTRRWDASDNDMLMEQSYTPESDIAFIQSVLPFFADPRYLRVAGKPMLLVYRMQQIPSPRETVERWRTHCRQAGIGEIHLVACLTHGNTEFEHFGVDAGVEFPPHCINVPHLREHLPATGDVGYLVDYRDVASELSARDYGQRRVYRSVFPSWDNTARVGRRALVTLGADPPNYERWLKTAAARTVAERGAGDRLVFINAWNEWAEGCHLEPDRRFGLAFLEATRRVKDGTSSIDPIYPPTVAPIMPPTPPTPKQHSYGLRVELGLWGARRFARAPLVYRAARAVYRNVVKRR